MSPTLRLALCASAGIHLAAVAAWQGPVEAQHSPPVLLASLRASSIHTAAMPAPPSVPAERGAADDTSSAPKSRQASKAPPRVASDLPSATHPPIDPGQDTAVGNVPVPNHTPVAAAASAVEAAVEPPRFDAAYLANPPPAYPSSARRRGIQGRVIVEAKVGLGGEARDVRLVESAGNEMLDQAAMEAVRVWRFIPARRGDRLVEASVRIPLVFRLD